MKHVKMILFVLPVLIAFTACKKGDAGPQGPAGNANVTVYNFGSRTFTGTTVYIIPGMTAAQADSSMLLIYYNPSSESATAWYPVPGLGSGGVYETRYFLYQSAPSPVQYSVSVRLMNPDGTGSYPNSVTFTKLRIFVIPASQVLPGGRQIPGVPNIPVDINDYHAVCKYYGIEE